MHGKQVLITGATRGIGLAAAEALAARGANVAIVGRNATALRIAAARITAAQRKAAAVDTLIADLASQAAVRKLAGEVLGRYPRLDVLINNAGAMYARRQVTEDGVELTWAVNHLAPFLLTTLLRERLQASAPARIITTASAAHQGARIPFADLNAERSYRGFERYGQTKLANILFTRELARRLEGSGVTATCFHPGLVATGFNRNNGLIDGSRHDDPQAGLAQPAEGRRNARVAGDFAAVRTCQWRILLRQAAGDAEPGGAGHGHGAAAMGGQRGPVREPSARSRDAMMAPSKLTVWYNTKCPVCNAGIDWQHSRLVRAARAGAIEFRDINLEPDALARFGAGVEDIRRRLHAVDATGRLHVGADCAIEIWLRTPGDAWLGRALGLPVIRHIARFAYNRFADLLYAWNRWKGRW